MGPKYTFYTTGVNTETEASHSSLMAPIAEILKSPASAINSI